mgnify:CR=1 FL=1
MTTLTYARGPVVSPGRSMAMRMLVAFLSWVFFGVLDSIRGLLNLNLGAFPMFLKLLYIRLLVDRQGYTYQNGMPERHMNRRQRRAMYFRMPKRLRPYYAQLVGVPAVAGGATIAGSRSGLFWKQTPGSLPVIQDAKVFAGNVFFVDANTAVGGTTSGFGSHPDKALTTWDSSVALCTANQGDAVFILAGHTETLNAAGGVTLDVAGISFVGLGHGNARPTFTMSTEVLTDVEVDSANESIYNMRFIGNIAALAAPIDVDAAAFKMEDCDFYVATATTDIDITVITDANADDLVIRRCHFWYDYSRAATAVTAVSTEVIRLVGADRAVIEDCHFSGNFSTSAINGITTASGDITIARNHIYNDQTADIAGWIDLVAGCTGVIAYNNGFHGFVTNIATVIDPSSCAMIENYVSNVVTEAGGIIGTRST